MKQYSIVAEQKAMEREIITEFRGQFTEEISKKYGIESVTELRLIPYIQYLAVNQMPLDRHKVNREELNILAKWEQKRHGIFCSSEPVCVSRYFWELMNNVLFDAYVIDLLDAEKEIKV